MARLHVAVATVSLGLMSALGFAPSSTSVGAQIGNYCDSNYTPCVPINTDVDCAGNGGNGPGFIDYEVTVTGTDKYDLDDDADGTGCDGQTGTPPTTRPGCPYLQPSPTDCDVGPRVEVTTPTTTPPPAAQPLTSPPATPIKGFIRLTG